MEAVDYLDVRVSVCMSGEWLVREWEGSGISLHRWEDVDAADWGKENRGKGGKENRGKGGEEQVHVWGNKSVKTLVGIECLSTC